jgi:hypothetical protein
MQGRGRVAAARAWRGGDATTLAVRYENGLQLLVSALGGTSAPMALRVMGEKSWKDLVFQDAFTAFRSALQEFVDGVRARQQRIAPDFVLEVVSLIEAGRGS